MVFAQTAQKMQKPLLGWSFSEQLCRIKHLGSHFTKKLRRVPLLRNLLHG